MKKIIFLFFIIFSIALSGCCNRAASDEQEENASYIDSEDKLENGNYYILHNGKYLKLYIGNASFDTANSTYSQSEHVLWFMDDFSEIPTMYSNDKLVYYTTDELDESFSFERFYYDGYTIGVCDLKKTSSGRYAIDMSKTDEYINKDSDAAQLIDIDADQIIIDSIGNTELRAGNITDGGTIKGLKKDGHYKTDVYVGTKMLSYVLNADSIVLHSWDYYKITDYSFLKSTILEVNIPAYFNSGYYMIGGKLFRYVNGKKYDSDTDFNVENVEEKDTDQEDTEEKEIKGEDSDTESISFTLKKECDIDVVVECFNTGSADSNAAAPVATIKGNDAVYTLKEKDGKLTETLHLIAGKYKLEITGLDGRRYTYEINQKTTE